jgi:hypothetical protein
MDPMRPLLSCECVPRVVCPSHRKRPTRNPERPQIRELFTENLWERFLTAISSLDERERRIDELTMQVEVLTQALREARRASLSGEGR